MKHKYDVEVQKLVEGILTSAGATTPALRQAVESYVARLSSGDHPEATIPPELQPYINKLALHAYKITDDDIAALKAAGYGEDAIFELTISGALGSGLARLEKGLELLQEGKHAAHDPQ